MAKHRARCTTEMLHYVSFVMSECFHAVLKVFSISKARSFNLEVNFSLLLFICENSGVFLAAQWGG